VLALSAIGHGQAEVSAGRTRLLAMLRQTSSVLGLSWAALALSSEQVSITDLHSRIVDQQDKDGSWSSDPFVTSLATLALDQRVWTLMGKLP
jgi:hypothetical protein